MAKLENLRNKFEREQNLPALLSYLDSALEEKAYEEIIKILKEWNGPKPIELNYYSGAALLKTGNKDDGIASLMALIEKNANHFKARQMLEEYGVSLEKKEPQQGESLKLSSSAIILEEKVIKPKKQTLKRKSLKKIAAVLGIILIIALLTTLIVIKTRPSKEEKILITPERIFPYSYSDYEKQFSIYTSKAQENSEDENIKTILFYLSAFMAEDYHLSANNDVDYRLKYYYNELAFSKNVSPLIESFYRYLTGEKSSTKFAEINILEQNYPESLEDIKKMTFALPEIVTENNLRKTWQSALMLYRLNRLEDSLNYINKILLFFKDAELPQKLKLIIDIKQGEAGDAKEITSKLKEFRRLSPERYFLGEAYVEAGKTTEDKELLKEGFFLSCPGRYFCTEIIETYIKNKEYDTAFAMANYVKKEKGTMAAAEDTRIIMNIAALAEDYNNCYFSYKELNKFYKKDVTIEDMETAAKCSEHEKYYEEALSLYETIITTGTTTKLKSKILELKYFTTRNNEYAEKLKDLINSEPSNIDALYSYLNVIEEKGRTTEILSLLDTIFSLEKNPDKRFSVAEKYFDLGFVRRGIEVLKNHVRERIYREKLVKVYSYYGLYEIAEKYDIDGNVTPSDPSFDLKEAEKLVEEKKYEDALSLIDTIEKRSQKCLAPAMLLKARTFRLKGDKVGTFSMLGSMVECDRNYLPAQFFSAEMSYYRGDVIFAEKTIEWLLENEKYIIPYDGYYHNKIILLSANIKISRGYLTGIPSYLKNNLRYRDKIDSKENSLIQDMFDKISGNMQKELEAILREKGFVKR